MKNKTKIYIMFIILLLSVLLIAFSNKSYAEESVNSVIMLDIKNEPIQKLGGKTLGIIKDIAVACSVVVCAMLGVKYIVGTVEERAEYKKTLLPLLSGILIVTCSIQISEVIWNLGRDSKDTTVSITETFDTNVEEKIKPVANRILTYVRDAAAVALVIVLAYTGVIIITGSAEQKAEYKKKILPVIVGVAFVLLATSIVNIFWNI